MGAAVCLKGLSEDVDRSEDAIQAVEDELGFDAWLLRGLDLTRVDEGWRSLQSRQAMRGAIDRSSLKPPREHRPPPPQESPGLRRARVTVRLGGALSVAFGVPSYLPDFQWKTIEELL